MDNQREIDHLHDEIDRLKREIEHWRWLYMSTIDNHDRRRKDGRQDPYSHR
jgi:hypothetical protein